MKSSRPMLINIIAFQCGWFACVLGAAYGMPWLGPLTALPILVCSVLAAEERKQHLQLLTIVTLLGSAFDQSLLATGWISYPAASWPPQLLPAWMMTLWALFGTTLNVSLRWLRGRIWLSALLGAISGPLAYYAGAQLGASIWHDPEAVVAILAVGWGVLLPLLVRVAVFFNTAIQQDPAHV